MRLPLLLLIFLCITTAFAQKKETESRYLPTPPNVPKGYFILPVNPSSVASLSGCFGDIRANHFHAGLDIRTGGVEGVPIFAAADGYVSRIKIARDGYGNAIYITHPNGFTTLYAHLKTIVGPIGDKLKSEQYKQKKWEVDLSFDASELPVKKGEKVALSGNTGSSAGPHLHFEIRDVNENVLDPALFGFSEIKDNTAPVVDKVILKTLEKDARINGRFGAIEFTPQWNGKALVIPAHIKVRGTIGVELLAYDKSANSPFKLGVQHILVEMDNELVYDFHLFRTSFDLKLDMNLHTDYERMFKKGQRVHRCYVLPGNRFTHYKTNANRGKISINDRANHPVRILLEDTFGNKKSLEFTLTGDKSEAFFQETSEESSSLNPEVKVTQEHNFLLIEATHPRPNTSVAYVEVKGDWFPVGQPILSPEKKVFVYDMAAGIPTKVKVEKTIQSVPSIGLVSPRKTSLSSAAFTLDMKESLYDSTFIQLATNGTKLMIHKDIVPLKDYFAVDWEVPNVGNTSHKHAYLEGRGKFLGGIWQDGHIRFQSREFGVFTIREDSTPPTVTPVKLTKDFLQFKISDNLSGIKDFACYADEEWILMKYEYKNGLIWSEKKDNSVNFGGEIKCLVTDRAGNTRTFTKTL
ncbi:MAG: M23 family metallopeptidase [Spirosomataceae bacterium]